MIRLTSPPTPDYNCIAWAVGEAHRWWWPDAYFICYWPPAAPRRESIDAFIAAYATLGFVPCDDGEPAPGFEKIALFALHGLPTHAARQLPDGTWTSKLGQDVDIVHSDASEVVSYPGCHIYGSVATFLKRPRE